MNRLLLLSTLVLFGACAERPAAPNAHAHHDPAGHASPYTGETERAIKSLSPDDIAGYRDGRGMGLARAAELNHYPGPLHTLELADALDLTPEQQRETERIRMEMQQQAQALGEQLIAQEAALDDLFADGQADSARVDSITAVIAATHGQLRAAHLNAHVALRALLSPEQIAAYDRERGYAAE